MSGEGGMLSALILYRMFQSGLGAKPMAQQGQGMEPMKIAQTVGPGRAATAQSPGLIFRKEEPERRSGVRGLR
jgi:hypothetical protein